MTLPRLVDQLYNQTPVRQSTKTLRNGPRKSKPLLYAPFPDNRLRDPYIVYYQTFIKNLLQKEPSANLIVGGDFNEFVQTRSVYEPFNNLLFEVDEVANIPIIERYTYVFDNNQEQLDHVFVSSAVAKRKVEVEHIHVNSWSPSIDSRTSDHDPSVARLRIC